MLEKVGLDVIHMALCNGKHYLVTARDDLSGWAKLRALANATSAAVAKFLWEDVVYRHGCFRRMVVDGGPKNKKHVDEFTRKHGIRRGKLTCGLKF